MKHLESRCQNRKWVNASGLNAKYFRLKLLHEDLHLWRFYTSNGNIRGYHHGGDKSFIFWSFKISTFVQEYVFEKTSMQACNTRKPNIFTMYCTVGYFISLRIFDNDLQVWQFWWLDTRTSYAKFQSYKLTLDGRNTHSFLHFLKINLITLMANIPENEKR